MDILSTLNGHLVTLSGHLVKVTGSHLLTFSQGDRESLVDF